MSSNLIKHLHPGSLSLTLFALPGIVYAQSAPPSALSSARTIQVHEKLIRTGSSGELEAPYSIDVRIGLQKRVKIVVAPTKGRKNPDIYVDNGAAEYEYDGGANKYKTVTPGPNGKSTSMVRGMTAVDFLLTGGRLPAPAEGIRRTTASDTVDGREMIVITDTDDAGLTKSPGDRATHFVSRFWTDAQSHLPYRIDVSMTSQGVTKKVFELTFSDWIFNKPLPTSQLAWTPPLGAELYEQDKPTLLAVGTPAPDFAALTPAGKIVHLSDYKGKTVVLDFWATWCGPCQLSMPHLESVYQQVWNQEVIVLGVCVWDQKAAYDKWVSTKSTAYTFPTVFDPAPADKSIAGSLYNVTGIPTQYVIDKKGRVAAGYVGYEDGNPQLEKALLAQGVTVSLPAKTVSKTP